MTEDPTQLPVIAPHPSEIVFSIVVIANVALLVTVAVLYFSGRLSVRLGLSGLLLLLLLPVLGPAAVLFQHIRSRRVPAKL